MTPPRPIISVTPTLEFLVRSFLIGNRCWVSRNPHQFGTRNQIVDRPVNPTSPATGCCPATLDADGGFAVSLPLLVEPSREFDDLVASIRVGGIPKAFLTLNFSSRLPQREPTTFRPIFCLLIHGFSPIVCVSAIFKDFFGYERLIAKRVAAMQPAATTIAMIRYTDQRKGQITHTPHHSNQGHSAIGVVKWLPGFSLRIMKRRVSKPTNPMLLLEVSLDDLPLLPTICSPKNDCSNNAIDDCFFQV